jgi:hypothetical protein
VIVVVTTERNGHPIPWYLESYGAPLRGVVVPAHYEDLLDAHEPVAATYVFADLELLTAEQRQRASQLRTELLARGCTVVNDPVTTLRRFDLLRALHATGTNTFTVFREQDSLDSCRFPVFVRGEHDHAGRRTDLLQSDDQVRSSIRALRTVHPELGDLLVVEFCDTADSTGVYRKYSAFKVGDAIVARHLMFGYDWQVKEPELRDESLLEEERDYVTTNPHEAQLRPIFELAGVEYGRIDYALREGRIEVWEINTNPTILRPARAKQSVRGPRSAMGMAVRAAARPLLKPLVQRVPPIRAARERRMQERAEQQPRARVNHEFADRLATAWSTLDRTVSR